MAKVEETSCPACGKQTLTIEHRQEAKPLGTWSLAGRQMKLATVSRAWIKCTDCGVEAPSDP